VRAKIDLRAVVRLIEGHQMSGLIRVYIDSLADSVVPVTDEALRVAPQHGDVLVSPIVVAGLGVPVIAPA
jgi:hypothetical protein